MQKEIDADREAHGKKPLKDKELKYRTTNRNGYREYDSCGRICERCPYLHQCTESQDHVKVITRHIWEPYMERAEDIWHTLGMKELYQQRKQTIERIFGTAKENPGFRYTQQYSKARMEVKVGLTFACMNLKKLVGILKRKGWLPDTSSTILGLICFIFESGQQKRKVMLYNAV